MRVDLIERVLRLGGIRGLPAAQLGRRWGVGTGEARG